MHDPVKYHVMGYDVSLRRNEAAMIEVLPEDEAKKELNPINTFACHSACENCNSNLGCNCIYRPASTKRKNIIDVALVGNPNSGKTSLFNALSGSSEHVGNYSGVTVDAKSGSLSYKGYRINITDLPGTYSISAYSPEERYVRRHLFEQQPDVIINDVKPGFQQFGNVIEKLPCPDEGIEIDAVLDDILFGRLREYVIKEL